MKAFEFYGHDTFERMHRVGEYEGYGGEPPDSLLWEHAVRAAREGYRAGFRLGQLERRGEEEKLRTNLQGGKNDGASTL